MENWPFRISVLTPTTEKEAKKYIIKRIFTKLEKCEDDCVEISMDHILDEMKMEDDEFVTDLNVELSEDTKDLDWTDDPLDNPETLTLEQLPQKSKQKYEKAYFAFMDWHRQNDYGEINEEALLAYFSEKANIFKSSTLWTQFSMIKATMMVRNSINIGKFKRLVALLKLKSKGFVANKYRVFTKEQLQKFLKEAPDIIYLMMKVALIIGVSGGCRRDELAQLTIDEVEDLGAALLIKIPDHKSKTHRSFTIIPEQVDELDCLEIYRKYCKLRPKNLKHRRFFLSYRMGVCTSQVVGVHTFGKIPSQVAHYLQLPEPELYNGHAFKKSSISLTKTDRFF